MKWLLCSVLVFVLAFVSCTTTNAPVTNIYIVDSTKPIITRFTPDTAWTFKSITIYGNHFGFYPYDLRVYIDTAEIEYFTYGDDTTLTATVPEGAQSGLIHITTMNGTGVSGKSVYIQHSFNPHPIYDTLPIGASFSIPGTGMNNYHGTLRLFVAGVIFPIDSIFSNRIVSHVIVNAVSGGISISDSDGNYTTLGSLTITRPSVWNTLSIIYDHLTFSETHHRTGYVNGPSNQIDSTWTKTVTYLGQHDVNVSGTSFTRTLQGLQYVLKVPAVEILWDTISQTASVYYYPILSTKTTTLFADTAWNCQASTLQALLPVNNDIEFGLATFSYQITEDSTDTQGLVNWHETTYTTAISGAFDLVFKK